MVKGDEGWGKHAKAPTSNMLVTKCSVSDQCAYGHGSHHAASFQSHGVDESGEHKLSLLFVPGRGTGWAMEQGMGRERHGPLWGPNAVKQQQELEAPCSLLQ